MGLFQKFKKMFKKPIEINKSSMENVVSLSTTGVVKLNKTLEVPAGYVCFLVCKEKICDKFTEGTYKLDLNTIPITCRTLKLNIPNKNNVYKNSFKADIYFVNLKDFVGLEFESVNGINIKKDKDFLGFTANVKGYYSYKVNDPSLLMEALLDCYAIIKGNIAQRQIDIWASICIDKKIEKNKPTAHEIYERQTSCFEGLIDYLNDNLNDVGLLFTEVDVTETILPKKIYKKVSLEFDEYNQYNGFENVLNKTEHMQQQIESTFNNNMTLQPLENTLFGNEEIEYEASTDAELVDHNKQVEEDLLNKHYDIEDLQKKVTYKKCKVCGAYCSKSANTCYNCKKPFTKICDKCGCEIKNGDFVCPNCKAIII